MSLWLWLHLFVTFYFAVSPLCSPSVSCGFFLTRASLFPWHFLPSFSSYIPSFLSFFPSDTLLLHMFLYPLPHLLHHFLPQRFLHLCFHTSSFSSSHVCDSAALEQGRGWSRKTWAVCCQCVTSSWIPASYTHCPCWLSAPTSWWCGSSSAWPISWPKSGAAEHPQADLCLDWLTNP